MPRYPLKQLETKSGRRKFQKQARVLETNRERFIRLAEKRTIKAIKAIRLIGNLSNRNNYSYEEKDVTKVIAVLENELKSVKAEFESRATSEQVVFKL